MLMQSPAMAQRKPLGECCVGDVVHVVGHQVVRYVEAFMDDDVVVLGTVHREHEGQDVGDAPRRGPHYTHWTAELAVVLVPQADRPAERRHV